MGLRALEDTRLETEGQEDTAQVGSKGISLL
jgi:hypothetical protein